MRTIGISTSALIFDVLSDPYVGLRSARLEAGESECLRLRSVCRKCRITYLTVMLLGSDAVGHASFIYDCGINLRLVEMTRWSECT